MKLFMRTITGHGIVIQGTLDTTTLPDNVNRRLEQVLKADMLTEAAHAPENPAMVDAQQYELTLYPEDQPDKPQRYTFSDMGSPDEVLELADELTYQITQNKRAASPD